MARSLQTSAIELHELEMMEWDLKWQERKGQIFLWAFWWRYQQNWKWDVETRWERQEGAKFRFPFSSHLSSLFPGQMYLCHPFSFNIASQAFSMLLTCFLNKLLLWNDSIFTENLQRLHEGALILASLRVFLPVLSSYITAVHLSKLRNHHW